MILRLITTISVIIIILACQKNEETDSDNNEASFGHKVEVINIVQANSYTYLEVKEESKEYWIATAKTTSIEKGGIFYFTRALEMKNFKSEDLNRTFETIYFIQELSDKPIIPSHDMVPKSVMKRKSSKKDPKISIEPISGGITIAELYSNRESYVDNQVKVNGQVTKFNASIMGKNWVHIQDGTEYNNYYDLTITTQAKVKVGDLVVFEGIISLNKDFGAGYTYEIILEEAQLLEDSVVL
jgi:hypothetical protein